MRKIKFSVLTLLIIGGVLFAVGIGPTVETADARQTFPGTWSSIYENSSSLSNANQCQLCHQNASGGDGWNAYGWAIRQQITDQGQALEDAINAVAALDSDGNGATNQSEISASSQPGWQAGANNTIYFKSGSTVTTQSAPSGISGVLDTGTATFPDATVIVRLALIHK